MQISNIVEHTSAISTVDELIEEARAGRPFILVDAEDRENEGDVVIPASCANADQINFMAKHARGLICLALTSTQAKKLELKLAPQENVSGRSTAFTIPIEAASGISTGISAHDRARTIEVAIAEKATREDIATPGHVFPLIAKDGGVMIRAGHTEAGVDIARLAGLPPAAVICEIMKDDGSMARLPDLITFAAEHDLKIGTIADLIEYRRKSESHVTKILEQPYEQAGSPDYRLAIFQNSINGSEHAALIKGQIGSAVAPLVRMHRVNILTDLLNLLSDRENLVGRALSQLSDHQGPGIIVFINDAEADTLSKTVKSQPSEAREVEALRDYGLGAQILLSLGVRDMILLTPSKARLAALDGYDLHIVERRPL